MAERRMFAKAIVLSDAFLDMPLGARCLYMTMSMLADDDGFVNSPKSIIRQCGATEDDLKVLIAKKFVIPFNSGLIVIKHWRINNYLRSDRYKETTYLEEKKSLEIAENGAYRENGKNCHFGIPTMGIPSIDKDSIDKDNINIIGEITDTFNATCTSLPKVNRMTDKRKKKLNARLKTFSKEEILSAFVIAEQSDFLSGRSGNWKASFDWLIESDSNLLKVLEGNYSHKKKTATDELAELYRDIERKINE